MRPSAKHPPGYFLLAGRLHIRPRPVWTPRAGACRGCAAANGYRRQSHERSHRLNDCLALPTHGVRHIFTTDHDQFTGIKGYKSSQGEQMTVSTVPSKQSNLEMSKLV